MSIFFKGQSNGIRTVLLGCRLYFFQPVQYSMSFGVLLWTKWRVLLEIKQSRLVLKNVIIWEWMNWTWFLFKNLKWIACIENKIPTDKVNIIARQMNIGRKFELIVKSGFRNIIFVWSYLSKIKLFAWREEVFIKFEIGVDHFLHVMCKSSVFFKANHQVIGLKNIYEPTDTTCKCDFDRVRYKFLMSYWNQYLESLPWTGSWLTY